MSFDDVLTHTGISSRTLTSLVEYDQIRRTRNHPELFATSSVLEHMCGGPPQTVFDVLDEQARDGQYLARVLIRVIRALMGSSEPLRMFVPRALRAPNRPSSAPARHV